jgi:hypothetical protein
MKLFLLQFSPLLVSLGPECISQHSVLEDSEPKFHTYWKKKVKFYFFILLTLYCWMADWKAKDSTPNDSKCMFAQICLISSRMQCLFLHPCKVLPSDFLYLSERMTIEQGSYRILKLTGEATCTTRPYQKTLPKMLPFKSCHITECLVSPACQWSVSKNSFTVIMSLLSLRVC